MTASEILDPRDMPRDIPKNRCDLLTRKLERRRTPRLVEPLNEEPCCLFTNQLRLRAAVGNVHTSVFLSSLAH